jgi:hypothetical protein
MLRWTARQVDPEETQSRAPVDLRAERSGAAGNP